MERYAEWIQERVRDAMDRGLTGAALAARLREEFDRQPPARFALPIEGFLEDAVAATEEAASGKPPCELP